MYTLLTIDGRNHIITESQRDTIATLMSEGKAKAVTIGDSLIVLHQITGIVPMETYYRQMKQKLSAKKQRMCRRCGTVVASPEKCPCNDDPEKFPDVLESARKENPQLSKILDEISERKLLK